MSSGFVLVSAGNDEATQLSVAKALCVTLNVTNIAVGLDLIKDLPRVIYPVNISEVDGAHEINTHMNAMIKAGAKVDCLTPDQQIYLDAKVVNRGKRKAHSSEDSMNYDDIRQVSLKVDLHSVPKHLRRDQHFLSHLADAVEASIRDDVQSLVMRLVHKNLMSMPEHGYPVGLDTYADRPGGSSDGIKHEKNNERSRQRYVLNPFSEQFGETTVTVMRGDAEAELGGVRSTIHVKDSKATVTLDIRVAQDERVEVYPGTDRAREVPLVDALLSAMNQTNRQYCINTPLF